LDLNN